MLLSVYLWGIRLFTVLALIAFFGVVLTINPDETGTVGRMLFFTSFFAFLTGALTLLVTWTYRKAIGEENTTHHLGGAFRQALLFSFYGTGLVFFRYLGILLWWNALLFFAAILLIEFSIRRLLVSSKE
ncbi:MAG: hypothetical protein ACSLEX_03600 [Minisyncoccota bacterium]